MGAKQVILTDFVQRDATTRGDKTDFFMDSEAVLKNVESSAELNGLKDRVEVVGLNWGDFPLHLENLDVIFGADVFYDRGGFDPLLATISFLLRRSKPHCRCIVSYQERSSRRSIQWMLEKWGLQATGIPKESFGVFDEKYGRSYENGEGIEVEGFEGDGATEVWGSGSKKQIKEKRAEPP
ncbi:hypothetical protein HDU67_006983 [Dinochytrium kinnereticum]|nr:hypothetical protein HDU67_006983 [Dinochytrium kinnereticum]